MQFLDATDAGRRLRRSRDGAPGDSLPDQERVLLPALAEATEAPESFLSKVLQALAHAS